MGRNRSPGMSRNEYRKNENSNFTAFELVFGFKARTPGKFPPREELITFDEYMADMVDNLTELQNLAAMSTIQAKLRCKRYYDRKLNLYHFRIGKRVYLINEEKKDKHSYVGPFEVTSLNYDLHNAEIQYGKHLKVVHMDRLKPAHEAMGNIDNEIVKPTEEIINKL